MGYTGPYSNILRIVAVIRQQIPVQAAFTSRPTGEQGSCAGVNDSGRAQEPSGYFWSPSIMSIRIT